MWLEKGIASGYNGVVAKNDDGGSIRCGAQQRKTRVPEGRVSSLRAGPRPETNDGRKAT
jgi:hypothetical protein